MRVDQPAPEELTFVYHQQSGSRANSLTVNEVEITRQFLATNNKVINRGDSFR